jgi:superfamily I DNA/RNA helicase
VQELSREVIERAGVGGAKSYLSDEKLGKRWEQVALETGVLQDDDRIDDAAKYLAEEYDEIVLANGITELAGYLVVKRAGRKYPFNKAARAEMWSAFERFNELLDAANETTYIRACAEAAAVAEEHPDVQWDHVLVDEAQDLHPAQWRLLRSVVPERENDLFVAGDVHQRIYRSYVPLSRVGINILGRSAVLRVNYRTTEETLKLAVSLLHGERFSELDDAEEEASLAGYRSELFGDDPILRGFEDASDQYQAVADKIERLVTEQGIVAEAIAIGVRDKYSASRWRKQLTERGIKVRELGKSGDPAGYVAVGTMHKLKGLEYRYVFLVDMSAQNIPPKNVFAKFDDDAERKEFVLEERCLLYVAATRAREQLWVSWVGSPSGLPTRARVVGH